MYICPQCNAPMIKKTHAGRNSPYHTLNCTHCRFFIFGRGNTGEWLGYSDSPKETDSEAK